jgi:hypothetical protein
LEFDSYKDVDAGPSNDNICYHRLCSHITSKSQTMYLKTLFCEMEFLLTGAMLLLLSMIFISGSKSATQTVMFHFSLTSRAVCEQYYMYLFSFPSFVFPSIPSLRRK